MIELQNNIKTLNEKLEGISSNNIAYLQDESKYSMFILGDVDNSLIKTYSKIAGIYYFEIKFIEDLNRNNMYEYLYNEWMVDGRKNIPKIIKKRVDKHTITKDKWYPFYIGKSGDIGKRLDEHFNGKSTTASLRLNEIKTGVFKKALYRVQIIDLNSLSGEYYWSVARIETNMRGILNPICGK